MVTPFFVESTVRSLLHRRVQQLEGTFLIFFNNILLASIVYLHLQMPQCFCLIKLDCTLGLHELI